MAESTRIQLRRARALVTSTLIPGPQGPPGPAGPAGPAGSGSGGGGGSSGAFTPTFTELWDGSPPTTIEEAINRLSLALMNRTVTFGKIENPVGTNTFILQNPGGQDAFIVKYNTSGTPLWARRIGGSSNDQGLGISSDASGNVYVTGFYNLSLTIFASNNTDTFATLANAGSTDAFIVKYDTSGTPLWARRIGGTSADQGNGISSDASGNVYITGQYSSSTVTVFASNNTDAFATLANAGVTDAFIVKYDTSGTPLWARRIGGTGDDRGNAISSDASGNVCVTGFYTGNVLVWG